MSIKDLFIQLAKYNQWAHKRLLDLINTLNPELHHQAIPSSFNSLYKTVFHIWEAESLWFLRLSQKSAKVTADDFNSSMKQLSDSLELVDQQWIDWVDGKSDEELNEKSHYQNKTGQPFYQTYNTLLIHIFNHNTYHNGQLVTILRALGIEGIPSTDFVAWSRLQSE